MLRMSTYVRNGSTTYYVNDYDVCTLLGKYLNGFSQSTTRNANRLRLLFRNVVISSDWDRILLEEKYRRLNSVCRIKS